ncbi:glycosyltransferase [Methylobacterium nonmethylotrophicum]|uniref:Glycosyltransferase family 1 protein n=1 Tax=Methylobacterium nonmethylotrophicum TaxID=1141884 RepID=A0A4Z0NR35_9HYPH|nr:glycosyltransferase [Methylobacterium nonmethylotrophicum]TGD99474.1 glycosyltransferase family 1 protein [Methylobacterium nonmethylotrophicum]
MFPAHESNQHSEKPGGTDPEKASQPQVSVLIWAHRQPDRWLETFQSACALDNVKTVDFVVHPDDSSPLKKFVNDKSSISKSTSLSESCKKIIDEGAEQVLVIIWPVVLTKDALRYASEWLWNDPRIGTVSFLSNAAGYLSFPYRNTEHPVGPNGQNEVTLTKLFRSKLSNPSPVPIPVCEGAAVLISRSALVVSGDLSHDSSHHPQFVLAEFSLRASKRGFNNFLDTTTFVNRPWDLIGHEPTILSNPDARHALYMKHHFFPGLHDYERNVHNSVLGVALDNARIKQNGLRILVDASELGPQQMGTQVVTLSMSLALAQHESVQSVIVAVPDPQNLPVYAEALRMTEKVSVIASDNLNFSNAPHVDIIHRPYQPSRQIPWDRWRQISKRIVITIQDVIGYRNGSYFRNWEDWHSYRWTFRDQIEKTDGIFCISRDVTEAVRQERLPIDSSRVFVVPNGVDHLSTNSVTEIPGELIDRGLASAPFILILGTTYAHKNRDLGVRVWQKLVSKGRRISLVMAGANVPFGTNRLEEAIAVSDHRDVVVLPDVKEKERNWLLQQASLVLYPTSAEGFGLVPFEAAQMNCPCLHVSFGPLKEFLGNSNLPGSYDLDELAAAAERLLDDGAARRQNIARVMATKDKLSWKAHADTAVEAYLSIMENNAR